MIANITYGERIVECDSSPNLDLSLDFDMQKSRLWSRLGLEPELHNALQKP